MDKKNKSGFRKLIESINVIRLIIINCIFFFLLIIIFNSIYMAAKNKSKNEKPASLSSGTILIVNPSGILVETKSEDEWMHKLFSESYNSVLLSDIIKSIRNAGYDRRIESMVFNFSSVRGMSLAHVDEIAQAIDEYKKSGKSFYAFSSYYSLPEYYLASKADKIYLDPFGGMDFIQFASEISFYKGMEEKFGISWNVVQAGAYKGAAEVYSEKALSENVRSNYAAVFSDSWNYFVNTVAAERKIPKENILKFANNQLTVLKESNGDLVKAALKLKLITNVGCFDDFIQELGIKGKYSHGIKPWISYDDFNTTVTNSSSANKICIINLDGAITSNPDADESNAIAWKIIDQFDAAIDDDSIKAVVLRINSGGGEVGASEYIRRALENTNKKIKKPVVVSMGTVAASGAYWIASSANYIFASPYTITGSIGVLTINPSFKKTAEKYLGITSDLIYSGQKPMYSPLQEKTPEEMQIVKLQVMDIYNKFLNIVSTGRNIPVEKLKNYAGGKVYSSRQALKIKLIDEIGTLKNAIEYAAKLTKIENDYTVTRIKKEASVIDKMMNQVSGAKLNYNIPYLKTYFEILNLNQKLDFYLYTPIKTNCFYDKNSIN